MTEKIKIQEVLVVEGKDDTENLRRFYDVDTYETRGSAINDDDLERIEKLNDLRGVIVFTDPDYNGERIRKIIMNAIPNVKHAFLNRDEAAPKSKSKGRSLGVEHASFEDLQTALSGVLGNFDDDNQFDITRADLMRIRNGYISVLYFSFSSCLAINFSHFFDRVNNIFFICFFSKICPCICPLIRCC